MRSRAEDFTPRGENILVRLCAPPRAPSPIALPETSDQTFASGPLFKYSGKGCAARVIAVGTKVFEDIKPGDLVLVDRLCGDLVDELEGVSQERELRMVCEPAIVAVLE